MMKKDCFVYFCIYSHICVGGRKGAMWGNNLSELFFGYTLLIIFNFPVPAETTSAETYVVHFFYMAFNCFGTYA